MIKIESELLEDAYKEATTHFGCSLTEVTVEVIQYPSKGILGFFKKSAIILASKKEQPTQKSTDDIKIQKESFKQEQPKREEPKQHISKATTEEKTDEADAHHQYFADAMMPVSFVSGQDDDELYDDLDELYLTPQDDESDDEVQFEQIAVIIKQQINALFSKICFDIEPIEVRMYNEDTLLIEFNGKDAALLIGKEGYRYKALSYMIFNWINSKYQLQLRLEIAEFLSNQEDAVSRYLSTVCATIDKQGHAQTKILDGVLIQIALKQLRLSYPDKYISVRTTRDNLKFIIINDYHSQY